MIHHEMSLIMIRHFGRMILHDQGFSEHRLCQHLVVNRLINHMFFPLRWPFYGGVPENGVCVPSSRNIFFPWNTMVKKRKTTEWVFRAPYFKILGHSHLSYPILGQAEPDLSDAARPGGAWLAMKNDSNFAKRFPSQTIPQVYHGVKECPQNWDILGPSHKGV